MTSISSQCCARNLPTAAFWSSPSNLYLSKYCGHIMSPCKGIYQRPNSSEATWEMTKRSKPTWKVNRFTIKFWQNEQSNWPKTFEVKKSMLVARYLRHHGCQHQNIHHFSIFSTANITMGFWREVIWKRVTHCTNGRRERGSGSNVRNLLGAGPRSAAGSVEEATFCNQDFNWGQISLCHLDSIFKIGPKTKHIKIMFEVSVLLFTLRISNRLFVVTPLFGNQDNQRLWFAFKFENNAPHVLSFRLKTMGF